MSPLLNGNVFSHELDGWLVSWESESYYRHWCYQTHDGLTENLLVVMFNPGSLSGDGKNLRKDTTLRILREVCKPAGFNPFVVNLFDYASPSSDELFLNWEQRDGRGLIYEKLGGVKFSAFIMAYGNYENRGERGNEIKERIALVRSFVSGIREITLPKNITGTPKHPMVWQRQKLKADISKLLAEGSNSSNSGDSLLISCFAEDVIESPELPNKRSSMVDYFGEKAKQISCGSCVAFGIELSSRYNKAQEMIEMLSFALAAAKNGLHQEITSIFYDSNVCLCTFEFSHTIKSGSETERTLFRLADETISQFDWFGSVFGRATF